MPIESAQLDREGAAAADFSSNTGDRHGQQPHYADEDVEAVKADEGIEALAEKVGVIQHTLVIETAEFVHLAAEKDQAESGGAEEPEGTPEPIAALKGRQRQHHQQTRHQQDESAEGGQRNVENLSVGHADAARLVNHVGRNQAGEEYAFGTDERPDPELAIVETEEA